VVFVVFIAGKNVVTNDATELAEKRSLRCYQVLRRMRREFWTQASGLFPFLPRSRGDPPYPLCFKALHHRGTRDHGNVFASTGLLEKYWPKLVRSYASEAVIVRAKDVEVSVSRAQDFLAEMEGRRETIENELGLIGTRG